MIKIPDNKKGLVSAIPYYFFEQKLPEPNKPRFFFLSFSALYFTTVIYKKIIYKRYFLTPLSINILGKKFRCEITDEIIYTTNRINSILKPAFKKKKFVKQKKRNDVQDYSKYQFEWQRFFCFRN